MGLIFLITIYKLLKRDVKNRLNQILSTFLFLIFLSVISNLIYASFSDPKLEPIANLLHTFSVYFITLSSGFLLLFILMLYYPKNSISLTKYQIIFISFYSSISSGLFFIPNGVKVEILSNGIQKYPVWSFLFFLYFILLFIPTMVYSIIICMKIYKKLKNNSSLAKRMKFFIVGISCLYYIGIAVCFTNFLNNSILRLIFTITGPIAIIGIFLVYISVGKSLNIPRYNHQTINLI